MLLIYVPCKDEEEAKKISEALVEEKLAVCVNIIPRIDSVYRDKGKVVKDSEALLLIKVIEPYEKVKSRISELHSYDVPAIACLNLDKINEEYEAWSKEQKEK